jgi:hypothetical protein
MNTKENEDYVQDRLDDLLTYFEKEITDNDDVEYILFLKKGGKDNIVHGMIGNICNSYIVDFIEKLMVENDNFRKELLSMVFENELKRLTEPKDVEYLDIIKSINF